MNKLLYSVLFVLLFLPVACSNQSNDSDAPTDSDAPSAECEKILAEMKEAQDVHNADYKAKGNAFIALKNIYDEINKDMYLDTDMTLMANVGKCEAEDGADESFCKIAQDKYDELTGKEKSAKEALAKAEEKSLESRRAYNLKLKEAADKNCVMGGN